MTEIPAACQALIAMAAEAFTSAPGLTEARKDLLAETITAAALAFKPTEAVRTMLACQAVGHHMVLIEIIRHLLMRSPEDPSVAKSRAAAAAESRVMLALIRELRSVRKESSATMAETGTTATPAEPVAAKTREAVEREPPQTTCTPPSPAATKVSSRVPAQAGRSSRAVNTSTAFEGPRPPARPSGLPAGLISGVSAGALAAAGGLVGKPDVARGAAARAIVTACLTPSPT